MSTHRSYTNPVHPLPFPDPFVLAVDGTYYAYASDLDPARDRAIEVLRSEDLIHWTPVGRVRQRLDLPTSQQYWAREVAFAERSYFVYYTTGVEDRYHQVRVAVADTPTGPFRDEGRILTGDDPFTIDAHPFRDVDGQWYLFYARDFLDGERVGTAIVVDRLVDMRTLAGERRTVLRASADWQVFRKNREMYGAVYDWYTIEGPFVVRRDGRYWLFYSGGAWTEPNYGISYAVADAPVGPYVEPVSDGPALIRSVPGRVVGPGHNCVVRGPGGADYLVYHAWDAARTARRMYVDPLEWTSDGPRTAAPTYTPQPVPVR